MGRGTGLVLRSAGELLITIGAVLLLFVAYHLWWTSFIADRATADVAQGLEQSWQRDPIPPRPISTATDVPATPEPTVTVSGTSGEAFGKVFIPRLRDHVWGRPLVYGVDKYALARGIGYYPGTSAPGQIGNFAIAGHRMTHGEPLRNVDKLRDGDQVIIQTKDAWFTYSLDRTTIVMPDDSWVINPIPFKNEGQLLGRRITVITCEPRWSSAKRWIWWGSLIDVRPAADGPPAAVGGS